MFAFTSGTPFYARLLLILTDDPFIRYTLRICWRYSPFYFTFLFPPLQRITTVTRYRSINYNTYLASRRMTAWAFWLEPLLGNVLLHVAIFYSAAFSSSVCDPIAFNYVCVYPGAFCINCWYLLVICEMRVDQLGCFSFLKQHYYVKSTSGITNLPEIRFDAYGGGNIFVSTFWQIVGAV